MKIILIKVDLILYLMMAKVKAKILKVVIYIILILMIVIFTVMKMPMLIIKGNMEGKLMMGKALMDILP